MALSNIIREPRREIIESTFGIVAILLPLGFVTRLLYWRWINPDNWITGEVSKAGARLIDAPFDLEGCATNCVNPPTHLNLEVLGAALVGAIIICALAWIVIALTHRAGEELCDVFARGGLDPRPKRRA